MSTKQNAVRKIDSMLSEAENRRLWGNIEVEIRDGQPTLVRQTVQIRLRADEENPDGKPRQE